MRDASAQQLAAFRTTMSGTYISVSPQTSFSRLIQRSMIFTPRFIRCPVVRSVLHFDLPQGVALYVPRTWVMAREPDMAMVKTGVRGPGSSLAVSEKIDVLP